jgi:hypothetical protein
VFRDETKATERKAQKANTKALVQRAGKQELFLNETSTSTSPDSPSGVLTSRNWSVASTPKITIEELASCLFISNFILMPKDRHTIGYMDFVLPLLKQESLDSHIHHAFKACAIAFLDNRRRVDVKLGDTALNEYSMALARTNAALRDRQSQLSDATLAAVLLLGMFEVCHNPMPTLTQRDMLTYNRASQQNK